MMKPKRVMLHCSATADSGDKIGAKQIDDQHRGQGWSQIGYHRVVRRTGVDEKGRPEHIPGAHTKGHNQDSLGVCYIGSSRPTVEQVRTVLRIYLEYNKRFGISWQNWFGHYEFVNFDDDPDNDKLCPGFDMNLFRFLLANFDARQFAIDDDTEIKNFLKIIERNKFHGGVA